MSPNRAPTNHMEAMSVFRELRVPTSQYKSNSVAYDVRSRCHFMSDGPKTNSTLPSTISVMSQGNASSNVALEVVKYLHFSDLQDQMSPGSGSIPEFSRLSNQISRSE